MKIILVIPKYAYLSPDQNLYKHPICNREKSNDNAKYLLNNRYCSDSIPNLLTTYLQTETILISNQSKPNQKLICNSCI